MNHRNKDVHIYTKYRLVFIFYVFNNIYTHHKHLKIKKTKKNHKLIKKNHFFKKNKDLYIYTVPTSRKLSLSRYNYPSIRQKINR